MAKKDKEYRLCYMRDGVMFFTDNFEGAWGDDWTIFHTVVVTSRTLGEMTNLTNGTWSTIVAILSISVFTLSMNHSERRSIAVGIVSRMSTKKLCRGYTLILQAV